MKKIISMTLATLMLTGIFASCAPTQQLDPAITIASSDAYANAEWLDERLDTIPDDVVVGVGSNEAYGINMSNFESDGYIVREIDGEVLIFGASTDGLDRAVRKYAKAAEIGQTANLNEVYHEGPRITKLTVGGRDISEYTAVYTDDNTQKAAQYLQTLLRQATGVTIALSDTAVDGPSFEFTWVTDETLNTAGFTYTVTEGKVLFACSDEMKGGSPIAAVVRFIENELDWFGLSTQVDDFLLAEGEVDIPVGTNVTESNVFHYLNLNSTAWNPLIIERGTYFSTAKIGIACHGLSNYNIAEEFSTTGDWNTSQQPCYSNDEEFYQASLRDVTALIESKLAAGQVIGKDFHYVDIAAGDNDIHCDCKACTALYKREANAKSATVVQWANRLTEELSANERYRGLVYQIFAYCGTEKPPRTIVPNEYVYVTFVTTGGCFNHALHGEDCTYTVWSPHGTTLNDSKNYNYIKGWKELTPNVYVWAYYFGLGVMSVSYVHTVYEDFKAFRDLGVQGLYWNSYDQGFGANYFCRFLWGELQWTKDITDEEFDELYDLALQCFFGDAWEEVKTYFADQEFIYRSSGCFSDWISEAAISPTINIDIYADRFDFMFETLEEAISLAEDAKQEARITFLQTNNIYKGCLATYFPAYDAYDDEKIAELSSRYDLMFERMPKFRVNLDVDGWCDMWGSTIMPDMEDQFWQFTVYHYVYMWLQYDIQREMPERYQVENTTVAE